MTVEPFQTGDTLIDAGPMGDTPVTFFRYADDARTLAVVWVPRLHREAQVPASRLRAAYPLTPKGKR